MFEGQPKGLYALALANTGERFGYYTMLAVFVLFLQANFGFSTGTAGLIYSVFLGFVYFLPLFGGMLADKFGFGKMVTMFAGILPQSLTRRQGTLFYSVAGILGKIMRSKSLMAPARTRAECMCSIRTTKVRLGPSLPTSLPL